MRRRAALAAGLVLCLVGVAGAAGASTAGDLAAAQRRANQAAAQLSRAETLLSRAEADVHELEVRTARSRQRVVGLEQGVRASAVRQYVDGPIRLRLLTGTDLSESVRASELARYVTEGVAGELDRFRIARDDLEATQRVLSARLRDRRAAIGSLRRQRAAAVAEVQRLAALERQLRARAAAERSAKARQARGGAAVVIGSGSWICPVQGPHAFSNDFGQPRYGGGFHRHQGNDILAPRGTPVVASVSGTVRDHSSSLGGLAYYLNGSDGNVYYGAHLQAYAASGSVAAGTVIGYVGNSGDARGGPTHLHFEIHPGGGAAVNPYPTLVRYC